MVDDNFTLDKKFVEDFYVSLIDLGLDDFN